LDRADIFSRALYLADHQKDKIVAGKTFVEEVLPVDSVVAVSLKDTSLFHHPWVH
jgi:hypothetical protein